MNTFVATAVAIPLAASSLVIPQAKAQDIRIANEDTITLNVKTSGLPQGSEVSLKNRKGETIETKTVNSNNAMRFSYENDFDKNSFVTIEVDGEKYTPAGGKCFGNENEHSVNKKEKAVDKATKDNQNVESAVPEDNNESSGIANDNADTLPADTEDTATDSTEDTMTDETPTAESTTKNTNVETTEETSATTSAETSEKTTSESTSSETSEKSTGSSTTTTQPKLNTDGSNTPVADPMSLIIRKDGEEVSKINYIEMKDGSIHILSENTENDYKNAYEAINQASYPLALDIDEQAFKKAVDAGDAGKAQELIGPEALEKLEKLKDSQLAKFFKENSEQIKLFADTTGPLAGAAGKAWTPVKLILMSSPDPQLKQFGMQMDQLPDPTEALETFQTASSIMSMGYTASDVINMIAGDNGILSKALGGMNLGIDYNFGEDTVGNFEIEEKKLSKEELDAEYYANLPQHEKDQSLLDESIAELVKQLENGTPMTLDMFDDAYDLRSATSFDIVDCALGFQSANSSISSPGEIEVSLDEDETSSDFDANKYFSDITNEKKPKSTQETTLTASEEPEENTDSEPEDTPVSEPVPSPTSSVERIAGSAPVVAPASQRPVAPAAVAPVAKKIAGPSVETGGSVDTSFWSKIRNILHI